MKRTFFAALALVVCSLGVGIAAKRSLDAQRRLPNQIGPDGSTTLPNGWRITPAGRHVALPGDLPMKIYATADGGSIIVSTGGYHDHSLSVIDVKSAKIVSTLDLVKTWDGMAVDPASGAIYLSGGGAAPRNFAQTLASLARPKMADDLDKPVLRVNLEGGALAPAPALNIAGLDEKSRYISGLTLGPDGALYVLNIQTDAIFRLSGTNFSQQVSGKTGYRPHSSVFSPDGASLGVSYWGDEAVGIFDPATLQEKARIHVGSHPNEMIWAADGRLFVANSGSNSVSVISGGQVTETIRTSLDAKSLVGSTPNALALAPDGKRLYVANADNNNIAVIDTPGTAKESRVAGFIPTGWYPTALAISPDGQQLYVGTGKGMGFRNNYPALSPVVSKTPNPETPYDYIGNVLSGTVSMIAVPDATQLAAYTKQSIANVPVPGAHVDSSLAARIERDVFPKIKHVVYIIRENRTYDQVFGDLQGANSDPKLVLFGEKITPNAHALSRHFVTLDNLYCNGEVSEDGHQWSNAAYATDFNEKAWTNSYSRRGEPEADERLMDSPAGYLWDNCARHNKTFRTYGEMANFVSSPEEAPHVKATGSLAGHVSEDWLRVKSGRDPEKAEVFIREMHEAEKTGNWPNFMVMSLGEDHTQGLTPNAFTPGARVGSNDQALGMIVEAISRSSFWKETAIFVIEDDAQNGPDHVDAHRTVGLVISPWVKRGIIDSTMYSTSSMVRTMELILGLPPMTQFDAAATPMDFSFTTDAKMDPIPLVPPAIDLMSKNPATGAGARASLKLDFSDYDRADPDELNRILWAAMRPGEPMPAPVRSARVR